MSDKPPAFPLQVSNASEMHDPCYGMSLRDWFAGQCAAAEVASAGANYDAAKALADAAARAGVTIPQRIAFNAYQIADAMLAHRATVPGAVA